MHQSQEGKELEDTVPYPLDSIPNSLRGQGKKMEFWEQFKNHTQARIGLARTGHSISTPELLDFQLAHALARDAVQEKWNVERFLKKLKSLGEKPLSVETAVHAREIYLKFPNLGRKLDKRSHQKLAKSKHRQQADIVFIITDGLSPQAVDTHFIPFWKTFKPLLKQELPDYKTAVVIAPFGRVALSDDIGKALKAKLCVMFVGERPGLTSVNSLGIYLTYGPKHGNLDANRNCISNIHPPEGLSYGLAAEKLLYFMRQCLALKLSGVDIKEEIQYFLA